MNFKDKESKEKLLGSYYTPPEIASFISKWISTREVHSLLEPACGDGSFIEAYARHADQTKVHITFCDIEPEALACSRKKAERLDYKDARWVEGDFIHWANHIVGSDRVERYDAIMGNPPFVRYQYMESDIQDATQELYAQVGLKFTKHANLWVAFLVASLKMLLPGGRLGMVIPEEIISVLYAEGARRMLEQTCSKFVLFTSKDRRFANTLQGFVVLLAEKSRKNDDLTAMADIITIPKHNNPWSIDPSSLFDSVEGVQTHGDGRKWTSLILTSKQRSCYKYLRALPQVHSFTDLAKVEVGIVTGANKYFLVNDETVRRYGLEETVAPMFGRSAHCPGVIFDQKQLSKNRADALPMNFVRLNDDACDQYPDYIKFGISQGIDKRYKCRIRKPWYRVPDLPVTEIAMPKRSSSMPRFVFNEAGAFTTDTAYRVQPKCGIDARRLVEYFQNSITALSAELEGRYYGGGVLELVPSEIRRLSIPYLEEELVDLRELDSETRALPAEEILSLQDERISNALGIDPSAMDTARQAWANLAGRRQSIA